MKSFLRRINWIIFFQALLCLVKTQYQVPFKESFSHPNQYTFGVSNTIKYVKIEVKGNNRTNNYVLSAYDSPSREKRIQLAQSFNGISKLYLFNEQFKNGEIYLDLECAENPTCSGEIKSESLEAIALTEGEPLNYFVTEGNKIMDFTLDFEYNSKIYNIWARGAIINSNLELSEGEIIKRSDVGDFYLVTNPRGDNTFTIGAEVGDFINVGFIGYTSDVIGRGENRNEFYRPNTNLIVDETIITGYLKKGYLEKVCYSLEIRNEEDILTGVFGTGIIFTKIANSYIMLSNGTKASSDPTEDIFNLGYFTISLDLDDIQSHHKVCVAFPDEQFKQYSEIKEIVYTYQFTTGTTNTNKLNIYEPQINGIFYPRMATRNSKVAFVGINAMKSNITHLNLMTILGLPIMTVVECTTYPLCSLDDETLKKGISPRNVNRFSSLVYESKLKNEFSTISKTQTLLVVKCEDIEGIDDFDLICAFGTLIHNGGYTIQLIEDTYYNQFSLENQTVAYRIELSGESKIQKIFIDIMTYIGEVEITPFFSDVPFSQYRAANKIFLSAKIGNLSREVSSISFQVKALSKTYYTVLVNFGRDENVEADSLIKNELLTGIPYLITIDPTKIDSYNVANKVVTFQNEKYLDETPMMINFNSLNCKINVGMSYKEGSIPILEEINVFEYFSHIYLDNTDVKYYSENYEFRINVTGVEPSEYKGKLCKIYASGIEISKEHGQITRDIIVPDNTPQRVMFEKGFTHISYGYVLVDFTNDILISFNLKHPAQYKVRLYYENKKREEEEIIVANDVLYLKNEEWENRCRDNSRICYIQLDITLEKSKEGEKPILELSIKSINRESKSVSYLSKGHIRTDYLQNDLSQYYYTEVGKDDIGYININFLRSSGKIYARIVEANAQTEEGANWRKQFVLPSDEKNLLIDQFFKSVFFSTEEYNCENGCYLLINVFSDVKDDDMPFRRNYPFSIFVQSFPSDINVRNIPIITASVDEFIVGNALEYYQKDSIYEIYQVLLTSDAKRVVIDLQSISVKLFVNVGDNRPTIKASNFSLYQNNKDSLHVISRDDILNIYNKNKKVPKKDLNGITLTIGVWSNMTDSIYASPYAFIVRLDNGNEYDIYRVNSDQKALCKTRKMENNNMYRCVYVIEYDYFTDFNALFVYPSVQEKSAFFNIYANYINQTDYEMGSEENLKDLIPDEKNNNYASKGTLTDFLYLDAGLLKGLYVLISVETDKETVVELMSSLYIFNNAVTANPSTSQLFMTPTGDKLTLNFPNDNMAMVNIRGIGGEAEIYWKSNPNNKYYLKGRDDRLSITTPKKYYEHELIISSNSTIEEGIGFIFYVNYDIRSENSNFDKLIFDKTVNYIYTENELPLIYYGKPNYDMGEKDYYDIFYSFNILESTVEKQNTFYNETPFEINVYITNEESILAMKRNPELVVVAQQNVRGIYDYSLRTGLVRVTKSDFDKSGIKNYEKPYLFIKIAKGARMVDTYKRVALQMTAIRNKPEVPVSEMAYQFGSLQRGEKERRYRLRTDKSFKQMNLQFSCLEESLIIKMEDEEVNKKLKFIQKKYGKSFYSLETDQNKLYVILVVKRVNENSNNQENFMFQYSHSNENAKLYSIAKTRINYELKGSQGNYTYNLKVSPVENANNCDINYIVKLGLKSGNQTLTKPFISPRSQWTMVVKEFYNPKAVKDNVELSITEAKRLYDYVQVIAQIKNKDTIEYLSYDIYNIARNTSTKSGKSPTNNAFVLVSIIVGVLLIGVVVALVIVIITYQRKNQDLLEKVNQVSFQKEREGGEGGGETKDFENLLIN